MKIIVAGMSKTGTKTMAAALRILGYSVYDFIEHFEKHEREWDGILNNGTCGDAFKAMYNNVDAVTDMPACYFWDEIHKVFPKSKIILTEREVDVWYESLMKQLDVMFTPLSLIMIKLSWTGRRLSKFIDSFGRAAFGDKPIVSSYRRPPNSEMMTKMKYRRHVANIMQNAPKDKLLVYNVKDGWPQLCKFLQHEIPNVPFPRKNIRNQMYKNTLKVNPTMVKIQQEIKFTLSVLIVLVVVLGYQIYLHCSI